MTSFSINIELSDESPESVERFRRNFIAYLSDKNGPLVDDFGPDAWGGYDGPTIETINVE